MSYKSFCVHFYVFYLKFVFKMYFIFKKYNIKYGKLNSLLYFSHTSNNGMGYSMLQIQKPIQ